MYYFMVMCALSQHNFHSLEGSVQLMLFIEGLIAFGSVQVVVGSFLLGLFKMDSKVDPPLRLTQGDISGIKTPFATRQISSRQSSGTFTTFLSFAGMLYDRRDRVFCPS